MPFCNWCRLGGIKHERRAEKQQAKRQKKIEIEMLKRFTCISYAERYFFAGAWYFKLTFQRTIFVFFSFVSNGFRWWGGRAFTQFL